jgi:hypothetical protein
MTKEWMLSCIFWFLTICLGYLTLYRLKNSLTYLPIRILLFITALFLLGFVLGTLNILPTMIGTAFLFAVEGLSFSWILYLLVGTIAVTILVIASLFRKRPP